MKLNITEIFWGINRRTGHRSQKKVAEVNIDCAVGSSASFRDGRRVFTVIEVESNAVILQLTSPQNADVKKSWRIEENEEVCYMPRSMDGGYRYVFKVL